MFRIRRELRNTFRELAVTEPRLRIVARLERTLPSETAPYGTDRLTTLCNIGIDKADRYGMGSENGIYAFTAAMLLFGEDFDVNPHAAWSREVLLDKTMDEDLKINLLELRIKMDAGKDI